MASAVVQLTGMETLQRHLQAIQGGADAAAQQALHRFAEEVIGDAKESYVPVRTGALAASGFVRDDEGTTPSVTFGFGGAAAPYAIAVHENPRSGKTGGHAPDGSTYKSFARTGQWKYLETPLKAHAPQVAAALRQVLDDLAYQRTGYGSV